ncbi:MAG TPA: 3-dehydroquinate synthase family protein, partial [Acidothermaceae bacterium]
MTDRIVVDGDEPYDVFVGVGALGELGRLVPPDVRRIALVHQGAVALLVDDIEKALSAHGDVVRIEVPDGEAAKTAAVTVAAWDTLAAHGFTRTDVVIGIGGGAVTDLAGFIAATWLRGVRVLQVPTTLLAMVDAAIGGKTGINIAAGKNLVGAFHPPAGVICDLSTLDSLPHADYVAGLAEVVKSGFIADPEILELIQSDPVGASTPAGPHTAALVVRTIAVKAAVVGADLREAA